MSSASCLSHNLKKEGSVIGWGFLKLELRIQSAYERRKQELWEAYFLIPHTSPGEEWVL